MSAHYLSNSSIVWDLTVILALSMLKLKLRELNYCAEGPETRVPYQGSETPLPGITMFFITILYPLLLNRIYFMFKFQGFILKQSHISNRKKM